MITQKNIFPSKSCIHLVIPRLVANFICCCGKMHMYPSPKHRDKFHLPLWDFLFDPLPNALPNNVTNINTVALKKPSITTDPDKLPKIIPTASVRISSISLACHHPHKNQSRTTAEEEAEYEQRLQRTRNATNRKSAKSASVKRSVCITQSDQMQNQNRFDTANESHRQHERIEDHSREKPNSVEHINSSCSTNDICVKPTAESSGERNKKRTHDEIESEVVSNNGQKSKGDDQNPVEARKYMKTSAYILQIFVLNVINLLVSLIR